MPEPDLQNIENTQKGITRKIFFVLGLIPLFGLGQNGLQQFELLSVILGASFGSIISLGIGPLVTGSIVLQLLNGAGIVKFDLTSHEGKKKFQAVQKLLSIFFIIFEAIIYVKMGGLSPVAGFPASFLILQLIVGGFLIMLMDEVVSKWGFGSGISLFIAAGVSQSVFIRLLSPLTQMGGLAFPFGTEAPIGKLWDIFYQIQPAVGNISGATISIGAIVATIVIFCMAVYMQAMKIEIPLSFGRVRGQGIRWPLSFTYASVLPVILVSALFANIQLWATLFERWATTSQSSIISFFSIYIFGQQSTVTAGHGLVQFINPPNMVEKILTGSIGFGDFGTAITYSLIMIIGCTIFSIFWVQTSGMDARSQANQIMASGLQIPGFRKDPRLMERMLSRYIWPLTVMGGIAIGILAAVADLLGALTNGTSLLLTVMIIYKLYEEIAKQHMMDLHPMMRKFME